MKRILYYETTGSGSGSTVCLQLFLHGLDRTAYEPVLMFGTKGNAKRWEGETIVEYNGSSLDNCDFSHPTASMVWFYRLIRFFLRAFKEAFFLPVMLLRIKPDLIHINCGQAVMMGIMARLFGIPLVWHIRELIRPNWIGRLQDRIYASCSANVIVISKAVAKRLPICSAKGHLVQLYDGVMPFEWRTGDSRQFSSPDSFNNMDFVVLLLGSISENKGYAFLAEVATLTASHKHVKYVLAGNVEDNPSAFIRNVMRWFYRRLKGGSGRLRIDREKILAKWDSALRDELALFPGKVDAESAIKRADIIVCPNQVSEPLGLTVMEAYLAGKPVLAMNVPAFNETVEQGLTGYLLEPDASVWAKKILALSTDPKHMKELGEYALKTVKKYNAMDHVSAVCSIYERALSPMEWISTE